MIFYFSGTGNSQRAAIQIAKALGDELRSINHLLKEGKKNTFQSERPWVFVAPTHGWRMPRVVERWIRENRFEGGGDAYFVLTCGGDCGNAGAYAKGLCKAKGLRFCGLGQVVMPENYIALYPTPDEAECQVLLEKAKPQIAALAQQIQKREPFPQRSVSFRGRMRSGPVNLLYYPLLVHDKGFTASNRCISCGKCAKRCPMNNIDLVNGKPVWKGRCTHCMACIGGCPTEAIEYGTKSKGQRRYYIMDES